MSAYYDPSRQRFLSEDPIGFGGGDANLYAYTFNSPTNFTDPTGEIVPAIAVPLAQCLKGAGFDVGTSLLESMLGGRKRPSMGDLLKTALAGCLSDLFNPFDRLGDAAKLAKKAGGVRRAVPSSPGKLQRQVERGQAPKSVDRVDQARTKHEKPNVHFEDGHALNNDGTWKHGGRELTNAEQSWLLENGWMLPR